MWTLKVIETDGIKSAATQKSRAERNTKWARWSFAGGLIESECGHALIIFIHQLLTSGPHAPPSSVKSRALASQW